MYVLTILAILFLCLFILVTWNNDYFKKRGVPYVRPLPFVGNTLNVLIQKESAAQFLASMYNKLKGHSFGGIFLGPKPAIVACDPEFLKQVFCNMDYFIDRAFQPDESTDPIAANLFFFLRGEEYKDKASKLRPAFSIKNVKRMFLHVHGKAHVLTDALGVFAENSQPVNILDYVDKFCVDNTIYVVSGIDTNSFIDSNNKFVETARSMTETSLNRLLRFGIVALYPNIARILGISVIENSVYNFIRKTMTEMYHERMKSNIKRDDFVDYILQLKESEPDITEESIFDPKTGYLFDKFVAYVAFFLIASTETNARGAAFALYEMAMNPEIQRQLYEEIDSVLERNDGILTYEGIQQMEYMDKVMSECLRMHPAFPVTNRYCAKNYNVPGTKFVIEEGTQIYFPLIGLHYDPQYFPEPHKFDPERFTEENKKTRPTYSYIPFGGGPRMCTATKYALMVLKVIMIHTLNRYELCACEETPADPDLHPYVIFLQPRKPLIIKLRKRERYHKLS